MRRQAMLVPQQRTRKTTRTSYIHWRFYKNNRTPSFYPWILILRVILCFFLANPCATDFMTVGTETMVNRPPQGRYRLRHRTRFPKVAYLAYELPSNMLSAKSKTLLTYTASHTRRQPLYSSQLSPQFSNLFLVTTPKSVILVRTLSGSKTVRRTLTYA